MALVVCISNGAKALLGSWQGDNLTYINVGLQQKKSINIINFHANSLLFGRKSIRGEDEKKAVFPFLAASWSNGKRVWTGIEINSPVLASKSRKTTGKIDRERR